MRAIQIIQRQFAVDLAEVHLARLRVVFAAVFTVLRSSRLSLTALGRAIAGRTAHKHGIKRIDRLLGNPQLHDERVLFYRAIARRVIAPGSRPSIIVDWTSVTPKLWALVAAVSFDGRALTIYAETHPISRYLKPYVNAAFLRRLQAVLPKACVPIILADAGFRSPFMKLVEGKGWDYVIRVRRPAKIRTKYGRGWLRVSFLFGLTGARSKDFGRVEVGHRVRYVTRLVGVRRPVHHRKYHSRQLHSVASRRERRAALEPWILATSLGVSSSRVVRLYARRMQIEETFRDAKNTRFGMCLSHARTHDVNRANVLLLLASFAHLVSILLGIAAEAADLHRRYQANTVRSKRVFSLATLGRLIAGTGDHGLLTAAVAHDAWRSFRALVDDRMAF